MWQWWVRRSRSAAVIRSPWKIWFHSPNGKVAGDQHAGALIAVAEDPEQKLDATPAQRYVAQLIADQQMGPLQLPQEPIQRVLLLGLFQLADQVRRREESHPQTRAAGGLAQRNGDVRFSSSVTPNKTTIVFLFNPFASRQLQDLRLGELRQDAEVERVEVLQDRELRVLDPGRDRVGGTGRQLGLGEAEQELEVVLIGRGWRPAPTSRTPGPSSAVATAGNEP